MSKIQPALPPGVTLDELNPDLAFSYELAAAFENTEVALSLEPGTTVGYREIQVGYTKRPAWHPFLSIHTADTDMGVRTSGRGSGMPARKLNSEFAVVVRDESASASYGRARLSDLKYDVITTLARLAGGGETYRQLIIHKVELLGITPEDVDDNVDWGFMGQVLALGTVEFK